MSEVEPVLVTGQTKPRSAYNVARLVSGLGYAHYQCQHDGERATVQEHQLVALLHGADPEKLFSDGDYHVHHRHEIDNPHEWPWAATLLKQFNYGDNLEIVGNGDHGEHTNGTKD